MAHTITLTLSERATAAYVALQTDGVDVDAVIEDALARRASQVRALAEEAAHVREMTVQRTQRAEDRELPPQIEFVRPPR